MFPCGYLRHPRCCFGNLYWLADEVCAPCLVRCALPRFVHLSITWITPSSTRPSSKRHPRSTKYKHGRRARNEGVGGKPGQHVRGARLEGRVQQVRGAQQGGSPISFLMDCCGRSPAATKLVVWVRRGSGIEGWRIQAAADMRPALGASSGGRADLGDCCQACVFRLSRLSGEWPRIYLVRSLPVHGSGEAKPRTRVLNPPDASSQNLPVSLPLLPQRVRSALYPLEMLCAISGLQSTPLHFWSQFHLAS